MRVFTVIAILICLDNHLCTANHNYVHPILKRGKVDLNDYSNDVRDCYHADSYGYDYQGRISYAKHGDKCSFWDTHIGYNSQRYTFKHNYCRNPDRKVGGPWCYINSKSWAYCNIPVCKSRGYSGGTAPYDKRYDNTYRGKQKGYGDEEHYYITDYVTIYHPITKYHTDYDTITVTSVETSNTFITLSSTLRSVVMTTRTATEYRTVFSPTTIRQTAMKTATFTMKAYDPYDEYHTPSVTEFRTMTVTPTVIRSTTVRSIATERSTTTETDFQTRIVTDFFTLSRIESTTVTSTVYRTSSDAYYDRYDY